ncbi:hypothetical protein EYC80_009668 [Monilinia laxa]|uniref:Uncharacterized protein n=1 Tax=Monilinia laxa TaxID=61186 RepID=A0A5N6JYW2_MONLA|nr:hypothetical protein EYC80_009668 [Monilinia laxa]
MSQQYYPGNDELFLFFLPGFRTFSPPPPPPPPLSSINLYIPETSLRSLLLIINCILHHNTPSYNPPNPMDTHKR